MTRKEYDALTLTEIALIIKEWERKQVLESQLMNKAVANAVGNVFRKKNSKWQKLWQKKATPTNKEKQHNLLDEVQKIEERDGKDWVRKIYEAQRKGVRN